MNTKIRVAVLDQNGVVQCFIDNYNAGSATFYNDILHEYLSGSACTFSFTALSKHPDTQFLVNGNHLSFTKDGKDYYFNIQFVERDNTYIRIEAYSLSFELLNEQSQEYTGTSNMGFADYLNVFDFENTLTLGLCEVSEKKIYYKWAKDSTVLARLFSLAEVFSAELEFIPTLNNDYTLKMMTLNVYKEHDDHYQGMGNDREDLDIKYGVDVSGIRKISDSSELYTCLSLIGNDGLTIGNYNGIEYDDKGEIEFTSVIGDTAIHAPQARNRFPSTIAKGNDRYIVRWGTYDTDDVSELYAHTLSLLKKKSVPNITYEVEGYIDANIGDSVYIVDTEFTPVLYLKARVSEQQRSSTNPSQSKTIFSNFKEEQSEINSTLLAAVQKLVDAKKIYSSTIVSDNGVFFKYGSGATTLVANILDDGNAVTGELNIIWYKDGNEVGTGISITVDACEVIIKSVYGFKAYSANGVLRGLCETTLTNVEDAIVISMHSTNGFAFKNNNVDTILSASINVGSMVIDNYTDLIELFGESAYLEWAVKKQGGSLITIVPENEPKLTDDGFRLQVSPEDVISSSIYSIKLIVM